MTWKMGTCPIAFSDSYLQCGTRRVKIHSVEFSDIGINDFHCLLLNTAYGEGRLTFHQDGQGDYSCTLACPERINVYEWEFRGSMNPQDLHGLLSALFKDSDQSFMLDMTKLPPKPVPKIKIRKNDHYLT